MKKTNNITITVKSLSLDYFGLSDRFKHQITCLGIQNTETETESAENDKEQLDISILYKYSKHTEGWF